MLADSVAIATVAVRDAARAKVFYRDTLGLKLLQESDGMATFRSGESNLFVYESEHAGTNEATSATWAVPQVGAVVAELKTKGVAFEHYDDLPDLIRNGDVHENAGMKVAWFKDPDGNILSIVSDS